MMFRTAHEAAESVASRASEEWKQGAFREFVEYAKQTSEPFLTETVRLQSLLADPPDIRAWGAIASRARRLGVVKPVGHRKTVSKAGHSRPMILWQTI